LLQQVSGFLVFLSTWSFLILCVRVGSWKTGKEHAFCVGTILWLMALFCGTEALSLFRAVSRLSVSILWFSVLLVEVIFLVKHNRFSKIILIWTCYRKRIKDILAKDKALVFGILAIGVIQIRSIILAMCTVPYNWDSMTYHLSRIMFWIEHQSVDYYETNIIRQTVSPVIPEYINLHVILFTGGDVCVNMLQCISSIGCTHLVYKLIRMIDCGRRNACFGCLLLVTTNIFVAEAVTTQTDMVAAFVLLLVVYMMFIVIKKDHLVLSSENILLFLLMGTTCGLLYITKSSAALPAAILAIFVVGYRFYRKDMVKVVISLGVISLTSAVFIAFPTFYRNMKYYNDFLASKYVSEIVVGSWNPVYLILNAVKNIGTVGVSRLGAGILSRFVFGLGKVLGININDSAISFNGIKYSVNYSVGMDSAGADVLIFFAIAAFPLLLYRLIKQRNFIDVLCLILVFQLFGSLMIIRWQPWVSRLLLPSLVLSSVPITYAFDKVMCFVLARKRRAVTVIMACCFFGGALVYSLAGMAETTTLQSRKALKNVLQKQTRWELYFESRGGDGLYHDICEKITVENYSRIGIYSGEDSYQYPLLNRFCNISEIENVVMNEIGEDGEEKQIQEMNQQFKADAIFAMNVELNPNRQYVCNGLKYRCVMDKGEYSFWERISR